MLKKDKALFALVFTLFLDFVGLFMVVPIFAPLLLDPHSALLSTTASHFQRTVTVGLLITIYGVGQFFGAPVLGELSDQFGRKKLLCTGLVLLIAANLLGAFGLAIHSLVLLFVCRFLTGVASGNASVIFAAVANISKTEEEKSINLGYLAGAVSMGVIAGPLLGAHFSNSNLVGWFSHHTPFLCMAALMFCNLLLVLFGYKDTGVYHRRKFEFSVGFRNIADCFARPDLRWMLLAYFFFVTSTESLFAGLPVFAIQKFHVNSVWIGNLFAWGALLAAFSSLYLNKQLARKMNFYWITLGGLCVLCLGYIGLFLPEHPWQLYLPYGLVGLACSIVWGNENAIIANSVTEDEQGKVLGVAQSLLSLALILGPGLMGFLAAIHHNFVIDLSLSAGLLALFVFLKVFKKKHIRSISESEKFAGIVWVEE